MGHFVKILRDWYLPISQKIGWTFCENLDGDSILTCFSRNQREQSIDLSFEKLNGTLYENTEGDSSLTGFSRD